MNHRDPNQQQQIDPLSPNQGPRPQISNYKFSPDELRVLKECDRESFFQRSLPIGTAFGVAAYLGVKAGYLKPSIKYGPAPKVIVSVIVGYFLGKVSYQTKCADKLMQLPNSQLAEMLKMRKSGRFYDNFTPDQGFGSGMAMPPFNSPTDQYSDEYAKSSSLNLDTDRPSNSGLDDTHRPNVDGNSSTFDDSIPLDPNKQQTTYDELRQKNRDEFAKKKQTNFYRPSTQEPPPPVIRPQEPTPYDISKSNASKNKYGDEWTK